MSSARNKHSCLSWTLWKRCLHKKRNRKDHSKKHRHFHNYKMICSLCDEWFNKSTMTMKSRICCWWCVESLFIKRIARKYNELNHNKSRKCWNNDCKNHCTKKLYWMQLSGSKRRNWLSICWKILMKCLILNWCRLRLCNWKWYNIMCWLWI